MRIFFFVFLFSFITSFYCQAQQKNNTYTYQAAQIEFWYPNNWEISEEEKVITLQTMEGALSMTFSIMQANDLEKALIELESVVHTQLSNPTITTEPQIVKLNQLDGVMMEISGTMNGKTVRFGVFIIDSPQNILLVLGIGQEKVLNKYNKELNKIIQSIKAI